MIIDAAKGRCTEGPSTLVLVNVCPLRTVPSRGEGAIQLTRSARDGSFGIATRKMVLTYQATY